jgi:uracil-DNA glycosylase family 4
MGSLRDQYLGIMGIQVWRRKSTKVTSMKNEKTFTKKVWAELERQVSGCTLCDLHKTRKNVVFGVGNKNADILIVGEAPGATEDAQGKPFVGRAGLLLDAMLATIGLHRDEVFIANILKCRPPNNRDPLPREVKLCTPYLQQQIALIKPKIIVAVGRIAAHFLLNTNQSLSRLRGRVYSYGEQKIPLLVTYHPAYLLRSPREKAKAYEDLLRIKEIL